MILSRFAGPNWEADPDLHDPLLVVDKFFNSASPQHPMRRWEYGMALAAYYEWARTWPVTVGRMLDVGGAGSPFHLMLPVLVIDPAIDTPSTIETSERLLADAIFSISVLEHVEDPYSFLEACVQRLAPGGLLFLTVDAWDPPIENQKDTAHFHWMRKRIFTKQSINHLMEMMGEWGLRPLGEVDLEYKGNTVYDYTFGSICLRRER